MSLTAMEVITEEWGKMKLFAMHVWILWARSALIASALIKVDLPEALDPVIMPVSYTHLDVYKRQSYRGGGSIILHYYRMYFTEKGLVGRLLEFGRKAGRLFGNYAGS